LKPIRIRQLVMPGVLLPATLLLSAADALADTLEVPGEYATITDALAAARNADIIVVAPGTYTTRLTLNKSVTLQGAGAGQTVLDGGGAGTVLSIDPGSSVTVADVTITHGRAPDEFGFGGGVFNNGILRLERCLVTGSSALTAGGGVSNYDGMLTLVDTTISGNSAAIGAGLDNYGLLVASGCTFSANAATLAGGGISNLDIASLVNCTVAGNTASQGGGIYNGDGTLGLDSVTVSGNTAPSGGGIAAFGTVRSVGSLIAANHGAVGADVDGGLESQGHNLIGDATGVTGLVPPPQAGADLAGTRSAPLDAALGPLQANGGPTRTMLPGPGSPAIDAGPVEGYPVRDQRGANRPRDGDADGTALADIGACEAAAAPYTLSELTACLRITAGFQSATAVSARRLNAARQGASAACVDLDDASLIGRKVAGSAPNP